MHTSEWVLLNYLTGDQFLGQAWYVPNVTLHTTHYEFFCLKFEKKKKKLTRTCHAKQWPSPPSTNMPWDQLSPTYCPFVYGSNGNT